MVSTIGNRDCIVYERNVLWPIQLIKLTVDIPNKLSVLIKDL